MSIHHYLREVSSEATYVRDESIGDLIKVATSYLNDKGATWRIEDGAVVFERPMGESLVGREQR